MTEMDDEVWSRLPGETSRAFGHFAAYRDLGPTRSLTKVGRSVDKSRAFLGRLSARHAWVVRAEAFDADSDRAWLLDLKVARREMARRHAQLASAFLSSVVLRLQSISPEQLTPRDLVTWLDVATKLERAALGGGERIEVTGADGGPIEHESLTEAEIVAELQAISRELAGRVGEIDLTTDPGDVPANRRDLK